MCLERVTARELVSGEGYKILEKFNGKLYPPIFRKKSYDSLHIKSLPVGKWLNEKDFRQNKHTKRTYIKCSKTNQRYQYGWHIHSQHFIPLGISGTPENYLKVYKVKYRNVVAVGNEDTSRVVIVAKEIFIEKEAKQ